MQPPSVRGDGPSERCGERSRCISAAPAGYAPGKARLEPRAAPDAPGAKRRAGPVQVTTMLTAIVAIAAMPPKATTPTTSARPAKTLLNITLPPPESQERWCPREMNAE